MMTLCELIGEELFESSLVTLEEESIEGNFIKTKKVTNEYEPKGISRRITETRICSSSTKNIVQEGVEESDFDLDEYGNVSMERTSIDCGGLSTIPSSMVKYNTIYGAGNRVESRNHEKTIDNTIARTFYMYNADGSMSSVIFDEVKGNRNVGNTKICDILYSSDSEISKVVVTKFDPKNASYEQGVYVFDYDVNTGMLKKIYLQQPNGVESRSYEEHVVMNDDYITVVSGSFGTNGELTGRKILKFKR